MSEAAMMALVSKGMDRQEAHELLRQLTLKSETENQPFKNALLENKAVRAKLDEEEIDRALNPKNYLGTSITQVEMIIKKTKLERKNRRLHD
jgi:adenylosuccinate lyase